MRDMRKMPPDRPSHASGERWKFPAGGWSSSSSFVPVPANDPHNKYRRPSTQPEPLWQIFMAWLRYHSIQLRWDIERRVARLLHRKWV